MSHSAGQPKLFLLHTDEHLSVLVGSRLYFWFILHALKVTMGQASDFSSGWWNALPFPSRRTRAASSGTCLLVQLSPWRYPAAALGWLQQWGCLSQMLEQTQDHLGQDLLSDTHQFVRSTGAADAGVRTMSRTDSRLPHDTELWNVKYFTRSKTFKPNFTQRKARTSRQFLHLNWTKLTTWILFGEQL